MFLQHDWKNSENQKHNDPSSKYCYASIPLLYKIFGYWIFFNISNNKIRQNKNYCSDWITDFLISINFNREKRQWNTANSR